mmetsp:Transcript_9244/g.16646  ORF Transcript_9244/g.16646 Transcript_9244/m.16646 type:complete len:355 (+) Transcript_9244:75-1139(+)
MVHVWASTPTHTLPVAVLGYLTLAHALVVTPPDAGSREEGLIQSRSEAASLTDAGMHLGMSALLGDIMSGCLSEQEGPREELWKTTSNASVGALLYEDGAETGKSRRPVVWVHLHNFAGTYMCQEASKQHERGQQRTNCLISPDLCSTVHEKRIHCHDRASSGNTFSMVERSVDDADFCSELLSGVLFRDPLSGALSTLRANFFNKAELMEVLRSGGAQQRIGHMPCLPDWDSFQHFDNFATRSLGSGYDAPPRGVTRLHLETAKARVASMDVVMILEQLQEQLVQLEAFFGWNTRTMSPGSPANAHCSQTSPTWTESERTFLQEVNALDYELLDFAKAVAANRTHAAAVALRR